jgi:hypothetical protein
MSTPVNNLPGRTAKLLKNCRGNAMFRSSINEYILGVEIELIGTITPNTPDGFNKYVNRSMQTE